MIAKMLALVLFCAAGFVQAGESFALPEQQKNAADFSCASDKCGTDKINKTAAAKPIMDGKTPQKTETKHHKRHNHKHKGIWKENYPSEILIGESSNNAYTYIPENADLKIRLLTDTKSKWTLDEKSEKCLGQAKKMYDEPYPANSAIVYRNRLSRPSPECEAEISYIYGKVKKTYKTKLKILKYRHDDKRYL